MDFSLHLSPSSAGAGLTRTIPASSGRKASLRKAFPALLQMSLFCIPALNVLRNPAIEDPDVWWHLRAGEWIVQHHAVPHTDLFCQATLGKPWEAYSWLFEVGLFTFFHCLGLAGIVLYTMVLVFACTFAIYKLVQRQCGGVPPAVGITFVACFCMSHLYSPRPWLGTILLFVVEIDILQRCRTTGRNAPLFWLLPIFVLWANIHVQFIDGLLVLALFCLDAVVSKPLEGDRAIRSVCIRVGIFALCVVATICNPYGVHLYQVAWTLASEPGVLNQIQELQSLPFRDCVDWVVLATALAAAIALTKQRSLSLFDTALFLFACLCAFRSQRDVWLLAVGATSILPTLFGPTRSRQTSNEASFPHVGLAAASLVLISLFSGSLGLSNRSLQQRLSKTMPVAAVEEVKRHHYQGTVFNDYPWGGYLIWQLRTPVSLDGRAGLHGEERIRQSIETWGAGENWLKDPQLKTCGYVIASRRTALTQLLRMDSHFRLVYEDEVAAVFLRESL